RLSVLPGLRAGALKAGLPCICRRQSRIFQIQNAGTTLEKPPVNSEWRLGVGHAIDVLRKDVVGLFQDTNYTPDFSIYSSDIKVIDARLPSFQLDGIATYQQVLSTLQWSVRAACDHSQLEITGMTPPINNQLFMRWRLKLYFKDVLGNARSLLAPAFGGSWRGLASSQDGPFIVEGYSRYEFDPWSAEIVKHTIDITNPPMFVSDLVARYAQGPTWMMPATTGLGVPMRSESFYRPLSSTGFQLQVSKEAKVITATSSSSAANDVPSFTGATTPVARGVSGRASGGMRLAGWLPNMPQGCEDDFECNDGNKNYPLQCCELPILGAKFCCEPPDFDDYQQARHPAWLPLPVPVDDEPWRGRDQQKAWLRTTASDDIGLL
ncbi:unnamed protein product, partial [Polarella glacialis]